MAELWDVAAAGDGIVVARFCNEPMGYFTDEAGVQLSAHLRRWRDPAVRILVITGDGKGRFITHYAVEEIVELARVPDRATRIGVGPAERFQDLLQELADLEKPVIVAMSGDTMGGGLELSLACDIRIAQRGDIRIGFPEVGLGILAGGGGTQRLPRLIGLGPALDFLLRAKLVGPEDALSLGIVHEIADDATARALEIARGLLRLPAAALAQTKQAVLRGAELPIAAGLRLEAEAWLGTIVSGAAADVMDEFLAQPLERRRAWLESRMAS